MFDEEQIEKIKNFPRVTEQLKELEARLKRGERVPKKEVDDMLNMLLNLANMSGAMINQPTVFMVGMKGTVRKVHLGFQTALENMLMDFNNKELFKLITETEIIDTNNLDESDNEKYSYYWVYIGGKNESQG